MSIYSDWMDIARSQRSEEAQKEFWTAYFAIEKSAYDKILSNVNTPFKGTVLELCEVFGMEKEVFVGFLDGINTSLKAGEYDLEAVTNDSEISLEVDLHKLYFNMLDAKADWLYNLPQWQTLLTEDEKKDITKEFRASSVFIAPPAVGRNDPCPCGSGKKYKKCCGA